LEQCQSFGLYFAQIISWCSESELQTLNGNPLKGKTLTGNDRAKSAVACVK